MSAVIDQRIVELQFDNQRFESNVKQSLNTLNELDKSLDKTDGGKAFSKLNSAISRIDFSPITNAAQAAANSFSAIEIAGMTVISRLTNAAINFGQNLWNNTIGQIKSGGWARALNIEQAQHMIKGFGLDAEQLTEDANYAVLDTAYGFDEASRAAATFGTAGVKAGDDMKHALLGVSGVASMTNSSFTEIADIYTKVATMGKLGRNQMESFQIRGLNVTAVLAEQLHKTQQEIDKMVSKGQIDFNTFALAMHDAFGEHAKSANETFNGAMGNMKAALSRIGEAFASVYMKNMAPVYTGLKEMFKEVKVALAPIVEDYTAFMQMISSTIVTIVGSEDVKTVIYNVIGGVRNLFYDLLLVLYPIKEAFKEIFPVSGLKILTTLAEKFRELTNRLIISEEASNTLKVIFLGVFSAVKILVSIVKELLGALIDLLPVLNPILGVVKKIILNIANVLIIVARMIDVFGSLRNAIKAAGTTMMDNFLMMNGIDPKNNKIFNFVTGLMQLFDTLANAIVALGGKLSSAFDTVKEMIDSFFSGFSKGAGEDVTDPLAKQVDKTLDDIDRRFGVLTKIGNFIHGIFEKVSSLAKSALTSIIAVVTGTSKATKEASGAMNESAGKMTGIVGKLSSIFSKIGEIVGKLAARVKELFKESSLKEITDFLKVLVNIPLTASLTAWVNSLSGINKSTKKFIDTFKSIADNFKNIGTKLNTVLGEVGKALNAFTGEIKARALKQIAISIAILSGSLLLLSLINPADMAPALGAIMTLISMMTLATKEMDSINTFTKKEGNVFGPAATMMIKMAVGVVILSIAVKSLASLKWMDLIKGLYGVGFGMAAMVTASIMISKYLKAENLVGIKKAAGSMVTMAMAMLILSIPIKSLAKLSWEELIRGLSAVVIGMGVMVLLMQQFMNVNKNIFRTGEGMFGAKDTFLNDKTNKGLLAAGVSIMALATAMGILAISIRALASLSWENLAKGLAGVVIGMGAMVLLMEKFKDTKGIFTASVGILLLSTSMAILTASITSLASLSWEELARGLSGVVVMLFVLGHIFDEFVGVEFGSMLTASIGMLAFASFVKQLVEPMQQLASISWSGILKGIVAILAVLNLFVIAIEQMGTFMDPAKIVNVAIAFQTLGAAISNIAPAMVILGQMSLWDIIKAVIALAGAFAVVGAAAILLEPALPAMLGLSVVLLAISSSVAILGVGLFALATGFATLAVSGLAGIAVMVEGIKQLITLAPTVSVALIEAAAEMCKAFIQNAPTFYMATFTFFSMINSALMAVLLISLDNFAALLIKLCDIIIALAPKLTEAVLVLAESLLTIAKDLIPELVDLTVLTIMSILHAIEAHSQDYVETAITIMQNFMRGLINTVPDLIQLSFLLAITYINGLAQAMEDNIDTLLDAVENLVLAVMDALLKSQDKFAEIAQELIVGLAQGLLSGMGNLEEVCGTLATTIISTIKEFLGIHSPSTEGYAIGGYLDEGVANGIEDGQSDVVNAAIDTAKEATGEMTDEVEEGGEDVVDAGKQVGEDTAQAANDGLTDNLSFDSILQSEAAQALASRFGLDLTPKTEKKPSANDMVTVADIDDEGLTTTMARWEAEGYASAAAWEAANGVLKDTKDAANDAADGLDDLTNSAKTNRTYTDKMREGITDTLDVMSTFNKQTTLTGRDILKSFLSEIQGVDQWKKELEDLATRGMNQNYLKELADQGPKAYEQIHAFYKMSESEMSLFNRMYAQKLVMQKDTANTIRRTFVNTGNMLEDDWKKFAKTSGDIYMEKLEASAEKKADGTAKTISETEQKAIEDAHEQMEIDKINDEFIEKWIGGFDSNSSTAIQLKDAFGELGLASMKEFESSVNFERVINQVIAFRATVEEQARSSMSLFEEVKKQEKISGDQMLHNMTDQVKKIGRWATNIKILADKGMSEGLLESLRALGPDGADKVEAFVNMTADQLKRANKLYEESVKVPEAASDKITSTYIKHGFTQSMGITRDLAKEARNSFLFDFQRTGEDASNGFAQGIDPEAANNAMDYLGKNSLEALKRSLDSHSPSKKAEDIGKDFIRGFVLEEDPDFSIMKLTDFTKDIATTAIDSLRSYISKSKTASIAYNFVEGFSNGLKKYSGNVYNSIYSMGNKIVTTFSETLGVRSPSVIAKDIMENFLGGALIPLENDTTLEDATKTQAETIADIFKQGLNIEDMDDEVYSPVIRPVWDDVNISAGIDALNGSLSRFDISGTITGANNTSKTNAPSQDAIMITGAIKELIADQKSMRQEIANLRTDTANLGNRIDGMSVYLDGSALVGQIVNPMDQAMGAKVVRQKRRKG